MSKARRDLIGRDDLLQTLTARIASDASVITLIGPPGVGKSAAAREALRCADVDATVVCDTSGARDAAAFEGALARALRIETDAEPSFAIAAALRRRNPVVLLDGFDHLVEHAQTTIVRLADEVPGVLFIVTSRERLGIVGEDVVAVEPLAPDDAVELFAKRAAGEIADDDGATVRRLVEMIDYNPLAIELAAARLSTFTPADLLERLDRRFKLLRSRGGGSLEDAIALSWELLDQAERSCLAQTTVFRGGFDLDSAEAVIELDDDEPWVLDVIESLVEKSLLSRTTAGRLGLSRSVRAFLVEHVDTPPPDERHARYYAGLAEPWTTRRWTAADGARAAEELPNLLVVLDRFEVRAPHLAVSAALALHALLRHRGMTTVHEDVLTRGIEAARRSGEQGSLGRLFGARGELGVVTGRLQRAEEDAAQASQLARAAGPNDELIRAEVQRAEAERRTGRAAAALARLEALRADAASVTSLRRYLDAHLASCFVELGRVDDARELLLHIAPPDAQANDVDEYLALKRLAYAHYYLGNYEQQHRLNEDALQIALRVGDRRRVARARQGLGDAAFARGDFDEAQRLYEVALAEHRELGNEHLTGVLLGNLGAAEHRCDALDSAAQRYHEALVCHQRAGATPYEAVVNFALGVLEHERGHLDDAAFHYTRAAELFDALAQTEDVIATSVARAWLEAERDDPAACLRWLDEVETEDADWRAVVDRTRALIATEPTPWADAPVRGRGLAGMLARALGQALRGEPITEPGLLTTLQGRLLARLVRGGDEPRHVTTGAKIDVWIGDDGEWFQTSSDPVNLRRRKAHRRILHELAERYASDGAPLDVYEAFDLGWPGESIAPEAAAERVYWVIGVLRRLGLDGVLLTSDEGYYLDPNTKIQRSSEPVTG